MFGQAEQFDPGWPLWGLSKRARYDLPVCQLVTASPGPTPTDGPILFGCRERTAAVTGDSRKKCRQNESPDRASYRAPLSKFCVQRHPQTWIRSRRFLADRRLRGSLGSPEGNPFVPRISRRLVTIPGETVARYPLVNGQVPSSSRPKPPLETRSHYSTKDVMVRHPGTGYRSGHWSGIERGGSWATVTGGTDRFSGHDASLDVGRIRQTG